LKGKLGCGCFQQGDSDHHKPNLFCFHVTSSAITDTSKNVSAARHWRFVSIGFTPTGDHCTSDEMGDCTKFSRLQRLHLQQIFLLCQFPTSSGYLTLHSTFVALSPSLPRNSPKHKIQILILPGKHSTSLPRPLPGAYERQHNKLTNRIMANNIFMQDTSKFFVFRRYSKDVLQ